MPGYLGGGGSSSGGGVGGEIKFPKEFIDPVTKLRVSNPQNLIDTDFEYGLQPTKWETVELINNTPSFFSKSGDTTIDGIESITTNSGTREITVRTELEHGLAVGIPINVQGTKSYTAEGSYIINSIPDEFTFTYLAKDTQQETASIDDLYSSVITGEFFQGSQLRISSIVTDGATPASELTVTTAATHGFGPNTPFYFLNLNSTIAQEFPASNTETRSFDSSNSATAQTFDGSNTLSSINIDFSNSATSGGFPSTVTSGVNPTADTVEVTHPPQENFNNLKIGQALYYNVSAGSGFFQANPRGVVFLLTDDQLGTDSSVFQVSEVPNGTPINITGAMSGTFQIANQARTFAGNNIDPETEVTLGIVDDQPKIFDGANENGNVVVNPQFDGTNAFTVTSQSGTADITWSFNTMVRFDTDGSAPTGLTNGETYFVNQIFQQGSTNDYFMRVSELPNQSPINVGNDGSGTMSFTDIGISLTKDIVYIQNHGYQEFDMLKYTYPDNGRFGADEVQDFYFVQTVYDPNNFSITHTLGEITPEFQSFGPFDAGTQAVTSEINIVGFEAPYSFAVTEGVLPAGLTLDPSTGVVSGTPSEVYDNQVVITMTDANGSQDTQTIAFEFTQPPSLYTFSSATFTPGGNNGRTGPNVNQARSGAGNPSWGNEYINMTKTGYIQWTVPQTANYTIEVRGASGGRQSNGRQFGEGATVRGDFNLQQGTILTMVIGQRGSNTNDWGGQGGGGGTFVVEGVNTSNVTALIAAAGGFGGDGNGNYNGRPKPGGSSSTGNPNTSGNNGWSGAGGSFNVNGSGGTNAENGQAYTNNSVGGRNNSYNGDGGFGGGGAGDSYSVGGAAGGYQGGSTKSGYGSGDGGNAAFSLRGGNSQSNSNGASNTTSSSRWNDGFVKITKN